MILEKGDMFSIWGKTDLFLFTSNPVANAKGLAVMGRGLAKQLADRYPSIRADFGELLMRPARTLDCDLISTYDNQKVGFFMVKEHWRESAKLPIIRDSVLDLLQWIQETDQEFSRIDLNFPGIGNGRLAREDVLPIIKELPNIVHVWESE